jgi:hypothetical protein
MPTSLEPSTAKPAVRLIDGPSPRDFQQSYWQGVLREFRNHLSIVMARSGQLAIGLPGAVVARSADCLADIEGSTSLMDGLLTWMDAALVPGYPSISEIGELLNRATQLATATLHPRVRVWVESRPGAVRNRGTALECALAALITEVGGGSASPAEEGQGTVNVKLSVHPGPGGDLRIDIVADRICEPATAADWRLPLARALLASVGGELEPSHRARVPFSGFEVRFRLQ